MHAKGLTLELTYSCNETCIHCYQNFCKDHHMTRKIYERALEDFSRRDYLLLTLTGGEPLLHPELEKIIVAAREKSFYVRIKTNALLLDAAMIDRLEKAGLHHIEISLYYPDAERHEHVTSVAGSFNKVFEALSRLKKSSVKVTINTPLMHPMADLCKIKQVADKFDASWHPDPVLLPRKNGETVSIISQYELDTYIDFMIEQKLLTLPDNSTEISGICGIGVSGMTVDPDGFMLPCSFGSRYVVGRIGETDLDQAENTALEFRHKIEQESSCMTCSIRKYCVPCPSLSYAETGSFGICSPQRKRMAMTVQKRAFAQ